MWPFKKRVIQNKKRTGWVCLRLMGVPGVPEAGTVPVIENRHVFTRKETAEKYLKYDEVAVPIEWEE